MNAPPRKRATGRRSTLLLALGLISSCALNDGTRPRPIEIHAPDPAAGVPSESAAALPESPSDTARESDLYPGSGVLVEATPKKRTAIDDESKIYLNFFDADLNEITHFILGEQLQKRYVIEPGVTGTVTIQTPNGFNPADTLRTLETLLSINNAALLEQNDGLIRIVPIDRAVNMAPLRALDYRGNALPPGFQTRVIPLRYVAASEMLGILDPFINERITVHVDTKRNLIIAAGSSEDLTRFIDNIGVFDVDWMAGMSFGMFPLQFVSPKTIIAELDAIFAKSGDNDDGVVRFVPLDRLNSVLAVAPHQTGIQRAETWIQRLDQVSEGAEKQLFVYRVQNGRAEDMANILGALFSGGASNNEFDRSDVAPSLAAAQVDDSGVSEIVETPSAGSTEVTFSLGDGDAVKVISDNTNNALVIFATGRDYKTVAEAIRKLDVPPMQVLIEASIVEVTLTDDLEYGVEWFFKNNFSAGNEKQGRGLLDLGGPGLGPFAPSFSYAIVDNLDQVRAIVNTLASESEVNVLSSPSLMVLGNQTATINVGDEVPIPTRQSVSNIDPDAPTVNEITYRDTGVILEVTPRVNNGGLVTMEVIQEVSDVGLTTSSGIDAPTFQQRKIASTVAVQSGSTIVLGGLIRDRRSDAESGVPVLYKVPILGKLFGSTSRNSRRTELLVLITPRAVSNATEAYEVTKEFRTKLKGLSPK